jgi:hypothetical protein
VKLSFKLLARPDCLQAVTEYLQTVSAAGLDLPALLALARCLVLCGGTPSPRMSLCRSTSARVLAAPGGVGLPGRRRMAVVS